jgi:hypothetical protein
MPTGLRGWISVATPRPTCSSEWIETNGYAARLASATIRSKFHASETEAVTRAFRSCPLSCDDVWVRLAAQSRHIPIDAQYRLPTFAWCTLATSGLL